MPVTVACWLRSDFVAPPVPLSRYRRLARFYLMNPVVSKDAPVIEFDAGGVPLYFSELSAMLKRVGTILRSVDTA
ncbi:hypothetical protein [Paraburkholderia nemoris]|uniref:hypothetical protein n=1 Tax=Paraburkholderia nemoris TaxID=2793076 RepID=UPI001B8C167B|nr:hypothetical protein [Paraburkholderia nemoris]